MSRLAELGREGLLLLCGDSTNADRAGHLDQRVDRRPAPRARVPRAARAGSSSPASRRTSTASSRSSTRPRRTAARSRSSAARCARTSTSAARSGHIDIPEGMLVPPREIDQCADEQARDHLHRLPGRAAVGAAPDGLPRPPAGRAASAGDTVVFSRHADPGQRARGQRDDRPALPHRLRRRHGRATRRSTPPATATRRRSR